jgi:phosphoribosylglycinamide formyltransferase-1
VHYVNEELDGGAIIAQAEIDIHSGDTAEHLAQRLIPIEHRLYIESLEQIAAAEAI